ncbi:hypothetical protein LCGC14_0600570 [marine sediment metagenome]|uniref:Uncharacterized protein n=1 Tax=marine sediment metagenome TaxID=412755 RepID=A0A0F9TWU9_9ZZZZ
MTKLETLLGIFTVILLLGGLIYLHLDTAPHNRFDFYLDLVSLSPFAKHKIAEDNIVIGHHGSAKIPDGRNHLTIQDLAWFGMNPDKTCWKHLGNPCQNCGFTMEELLKANNASNNVAFGPKALHNYRARHIISEQERARVAQKYLRDGLSF